MRQVRVFFLILSVFLLFSFFSCFLLDPDENCVTVGIKNSTSGPITVSGAVCWSGGTIPAGTSKNISVELGRFVIADGHNHIFTQANEIWEIW
jgi:hypothetical protein